jgi:hypothetical protein
LNTAEGDSENFTEQDTTMDEHVESVHCPPPVDQDSRRTFTFNLDAPTADDLPDYESLDGHEDTKEDDTAMPFEEATLTNFFRSPVKTTQAAHVESPEKIEYPTLPSDALETETKALVDTVMEEVATSEEVHRLVESTVAEEVNVESAGLQEEIFPQLDESAEVEKSATVLDEPQTAMEGPAASAEIAYPSLPTEEDQSPDEDEDAHTMSEPTPELQAEEHLDDIQHLAEVSPSSPEADNADEDFTEASLQLAIMREYQETLQKHQAARTGVKAQSDVADDTEEEQETGIERSIADGLESAMHDIAPQEPLQTLSSSPSRTQDVDMTEVTGDDITDGLALSLTPAKTTSAEPTPRKLHSPPPPLRMESGPDDVTMTIAIDDDTAILKDFLTRAAASKAEKAAITTHRRESLQNRRDSDVVRHALASPRKALEEKDPNSPTKHNNGMTLDLSQTLTLGMPTEPLPSPTPDSTTPTESTEEDQTAKGSRRSTRAKKSRLPAPASTIQQPQQAPKIAIRRADGNEVVVLKKDEAKVLADVTRANTRKNKQGAFGVTVRLMKIAIDSAALPPLDEDAPKEIIVGRNVRWDEQLAYFQENPEVIAEAESLATPDELGFDEQPDRKKQKMSKNSTPKIKRARGLGTQNGTPAKGVGGKLDGSSPPLVMSEKEKEKDTHLPKLKPSKAVKRTLDSSTTQQRAKDEPSHHLPPLDFIPVGVQSSSTSTSTQRKSRLMAPKRVVLPSSSTTTPTPTPTVSGEGKENGKRARGAETMGKKSIPAPKVVVPPTATATVVGMESGLPRRRGRK